MQWGVELLLRTSLCAGPCAQSQQLDAAARQDAQVCPPSALSAQRLWQRTNSSSKVSLRVSLAEQFIFCNEKKSIKLFPREQGQVEMTAVEDNSVIVFKNEILCGGEGISGHS